MRLEASFFCPILCYLGEQTTPYFATIFQVGHLVIEGDQVGQAETAFHKPMLSGSNPTVILHVFCHVTALRMTCSRTAPKVRLTALALGVPCLNREAKSVPLGQAESQIQTPRTTEYPELEGTHKDYGIRTPGFAQDIPKSHTMLCLRVSSKLLLNSDKLGTGRPVPEPDTLR
ncbi:hypothetical protein TURU_097010 [Turdus rufiventris]|nr:hypothetical protein TURU_097010 [Turdus rufiventris]